MKTMYLIIIYLVAATAAATFNQYQTHGSFNIVYILVIFFLSLNLLVNYWELILWYRKDYIKEKGDQYYSEHQDDKGLPMMNFLQSKTTFSNMFSTKHWADAWIGYSLFDRSYANHKSFGFAADVGNGLSTLIPSLLLHVGFTYHFLDANVLGMIMLAAMWQMSYGTFVYWFSFFVNGRHKLLSLQQNITVIFGANVPWVMFCFVGIYAAVRLILDNNFSVFGI